MNLIERLRARKQSFYSEATRASEWRTEPLCAEAIAEIERLTVQVEVLRQALEKISRAYEAWDPDGSFASTLLSQASNEARAALSYRGGD